ncbi:MAG: hypothetical protein HY297_00475 [Thaumarchaeota archaeon]|nr:hypothetical protein [Nitrososphaerota archaeon]
MSDWRGETAADLKDAETRLESLASAISGEPDAAQLRSMWRSYVDLEKSIVFIRVEIDEENPGRFIKIRAYSVPDERQALQFSLKNLRRGSASFAAGDFKQALKELRESRNYLRALLRAKRLKRARGARGQRKA